MNLAPRRSARYAVNLAVGSKVSVRLASVSRMIEGTVVATEGDYTVIVQVAALHIAVDVEDCSEIVDQQAARQPATWQATRC